MQLCASHLYNDIYTNVYVVQPTRREYEEGLAGTDVKRKDESIRKLAKEPLEGDEE
ncbi:MAG: hypothetical protein M3Y53_12435 [Thermoproteota archaeon]|nr:hypothetical protein [Thermoproteota archaeon]